MIVSRSSPVAEVLSGWICRCERDGPREATETVDCDHIRAHSTFDRELERESVLRPKQSAFFAFSVMRMALESSEKDIRDIFLPLLKKLSESRFGTTLEYSD